MKIRGQGFKADESVRPAVELGWTVTFASMPVTPNEGFWFDGDDGRYLTVNRRPEFGGVFTVSFRTGNREEADRRYYREPRDVARAYLGWAHNDGGTRGRPS